MTASAKNQLSAHQETDLTFAPHMNAKRPNQHPFLYVAVLIALAVTIVYFVWQGTVGPKEIVTAFLATVGTFIGALFAFRLNEAKENRLVEKEQRIALNRALFVIIRQYNAALHLKKQLDPFKTEFDRAFNCPAFKPPSYTDVLVDFESLSFLLEFIDPNILMRISIEQEGFHQTMETLRIRNELYIDEVQPAVAKHGLNQRTVAIPEFESALGERIFKSAINYSTTLYEHIEQSCERLLKIQADLSDVAKKMYPDAKFIKIQQT